MTLSPLDDLPIHQAPEVMRHVATSDRNFYDRYYFNCHPGSDELMLIVGMGQYPNLGVTDAFAVVRHAHLHRVVRASRELGLDRMDTGVGPFRIEVLEGLKRLRVVLEPNEHGLSFDLTWTGAIPATLEPRHFVRWQERVIFDSVRMAQTGHWSGSIVLDSRTIPVDTWMGTRDRSWGIRPVGEPEPPGIQVKNPGTFYWLYAPMQFEDHAILCIVQEDEKGRRVLEEAVRVWSDGREEEYLGRPEYHPVYARHPRRRRGHHHHREDRGALHADPARPPDGRHRVRPGARLEARDVPGERARGRGGDLHLARGRRPHVGHGGRGRTLRV
ncbi:hypothetical protein ACFQGX_15650 [Nonomuraea dietziae]|uniref:hypothetical protein n=1 Tax=Nonomuraea dietziae TaxID=65515 RepID=UPI00361FFBA6